MAVTCLFSFFVVVFLFFHLYLTGGFFCQSVRPGSTAPGTQGLGVCSESARVRLSEYLQVGYSWLASPAVSQNDTDALKGLEEGVCEANQGGGIISYLRWKGRWRVCVSAF